MIVFFFQPFFTIFARFAVCSLLGADIYASVLIVTVVGFTTVNDTRVSKQEYDDTVCYTR